MNYFFKNLLILLILIICTQSVFAGYVKGYYKKDGTYVSPHYRNESVKSYSKSKSYKTTYPKTYTSRPYIKRTYRTDGAMGF